MEIPKDGKYYLAWHKTQGFLLVNSKPTSDYFYTSDIHSLGFYANEFIRWMDEKGQWNEV